MRTASSGTVGRIVTITGAIGTLAACTGSRGPAGPVLTGTRTGVVYLFDQFGGALASDSGMTVTANPGDISDVSNNGGQYSLADLKTGVYTISYAENGFGTFLQPRVGFLGGGISQVAPLDLSQKSTAVIAGVSATPNVAGDTILVTGTMNTPPAGVTRNVRLFFSTSATPAAAVGQYTVTTVKTGFSASPFTYHLTGTDLESVRNNFSTGSTVNLAAYGDSFYENSYEDSTSGQTVYPNVSAPSNVASFVMP